MDNTKFSGHIWRSKYRYSGGPEDSDADIADTWRRVATAAALVETDPARWQQAFFEILHDYRFLPGGRILAGAGTAKRVTLFNCFVMGPIPDSIGDIFESLGEAAITMHQGGGIGCDFSMLRPSGSPAVCSGGIASGPVPFMRIWDTLCDTLLNTSTRRGAMMATLRCDHPDIEAFVDAKREKQALENFNLSVLITDDFMRAVDNDAEWKLLHPVTDGQTGKTHRILPARRLWGNIAAAAHEAAEPGVLFLDTINRDNNLHYCETISATNPCGEIPLPPYGACDLGSINLTRFVRKPFTKDAELDEQAIAGTVGVAVRFLDNIIDISRFPLNQQAEQAQRTRRVGLGVTGLADMLAMLRLHYDSDAGRAAAAKLMQGIRNAAYASSLELAKEKGSFPALSRKHFLDAPFIDRLPGDLKSGIAETGLRNSHLLAIAPAGTISLLANNVSSGIEPIYALEAERDVRCSDLEVRRFGIRDHAYDAWLADANDRSDLPDYFVTADALPPRAHLDMQACLQCYVDNAISKTINLPGSATVKDVEDIYRNAYQSGIKGCTVFRHGAARGQVLRDRDDSHCCHVDREAD